MEHMSTTTNHTEHTMSNANNASNTASIGSIVEYEDQANAPRRYVVVALPGADDFGQFTMRVLDADIGYAYTTSDLRQAGWKLVSA
jgi:ABC-type molybdate transport system substrate-binding protein